MAAVGVVSLCAVIYAALSVVFVSMLLMVWCCLVVAPGTDDRTVAVDTLLLVLAVFMDDIDLLARILCDILDADALPVLLMLLLPPLLPNLNLLLVLSRLSVCCLDIKLMAKLALILQYIISATPDPRLKKEKCKIERELKVTKLLGGRKV